MKTLLEVEKEHIVAVLEAHPNLDDAARILGIHSTTLYRKRVRMKLPLTFRPKKPTHEKPIAAQTPEAVFKETGFRTYKEIRAVLRKP